MVSGKNKSTNKVQKEGLEVHTDLLLFDGNYRYLPAMQNYAHISSCLADMVVLKSSGEVCIETSFGSYMAICTGWVHAWVVP